MYQSGAIGGATVATTAGAGLAATGVAVGYYVLAAFALIAAGSALLRIIPRREG